MTMTTLDFKDHREAAFTIVGPQFDTKNKTQKMSSSNENQGKSGATTKGNSDKRSMSRPRSCAN